MNFEFEHHLLLIFWWKMRLSLWRTWKLAIIVLLVITFYKWLIAFCQCHQSTPNKWRIYVTLFYVYLLCNVQFYIILFCSSYCLPLIKVSAGCSILRTVQPNWCFVVIFFFPLVYSLFEKRFQPLGHPLVLSTRLIGVVFHKALRSIPIRCWLLYRLSNHSLLSMLLKVEGFHLLICHTLFSNFTIFSFFFNFLFRVLCFIFAFITSCFCFHISIIIALFSK